MYVLPSYLYKRCQSHTPCTLMHTHTHTHHSVPWCITFGSGDFFCSAIFLCVTCCFPWRMWWFSGMIEPTSITWHIRIQDGHVCVCVYVKLLEKERNDWLPVKYYKYSTIKNSKMDVLISYWYLNLSQFKLFLYIVMYFEN